MHFCFFKKKNCSYLSIKLFFCVHLCNVIMHTHLCSMHSLTVWVKSSIISVDFWVLFTCNFLTGKDGKDGQNGKFSIYISSLSKHFWPKHSSPLKNPYLVTKCLFFYSHRKRWSRWSKRWCSQFFYSQKYIFFSSAVDAKVFTSM